MSRGSPVSFAMLCSAAVFVAGCGHPRSAADNAPPAAALAGEKIVNLFIWADYLAPDTLAQFEKQTGIKVRVSNFDSPEALESRMLVGNSGFDVVVPTVTFIQREIRSGAYLPLDKSKLPHLTNLDSGLMSKIARNDPGNTYTVAYTWGTFGIGYNEKMVAQALPRVPLDSWRIILDPKFAAKLAPCGINVLDDPVGAVRMVLLYLGRNPDAPTSQDLVHVQDVLAKIRPYVRNIDTSGEIEALANGDICVTLGYNGDVVQSRKRAAEAKNGQKINFIIPKEGTELWVDLLAIPKDAPHVENAHLLINYLMDPAVIAKITNAIGFANANPASLPLLDPAVAADTTIYPTAEEQERLHVPAEPSPEQSRAITRLWQKFKTGQ